MKLVIAEKPMLARDIARAICGVPVSESARLPISGNGYTVVGCAGHLLELAEPEQIDPKWGSPWNVAALPVVIYDWPKVPAKGKEELVEQIAGLLEGCDGVVHAGDPDDEGQLIVDELLDYLGYEGEVERVYVNDNIDKNIRKAFDHLLPNSECRGAGEAAYARQMGDMCFGANETRLATKRLGDLFSVGRVQTPTLGLVVARDEQIEHHVKQKYYELTAQIGSIDGSAAGERFPFKFKSSDALLAGEKRLYSPDALETIARALEGAEKGFETALSEKTKHAPLPYNLTVLLADMSRRYGMSAADTQQITQDLRDKYKAITYNRSDCQYLKEEHFADAQATLLCAMMNLGVDWPLDFTIKSKAFNDGNVTAHHGIIPQEIGVDMERMTDAERKVYTAIVERYAMQFLPPAVYDVSTSAFDVEEGRFEHVSKRLRQAGWLATFGGASGEDDEEAEDGGWLEAGHHTGKVDGTEIAEKETAPPKPYTEGTLITDMASIAKYVTDPEVKAVLKQKDDGKKGEHGGIGTTATRSNIIETLKRRGFIAEEKGKVRSTPKGRAFYGLLPDDIKSADTTARWWLIQQDVADGRQDVNAVQRSVVEVFERHKDTAYVGASIPGRERIAVSKCPRCGEDMVQTGTIYQCSSNRSEKQDDGSWEQVSGCGFKLFGFCDKRFTAKQAQSLLAGKTVALRGCTPKSGKKFDCKVRLTGEKIEIVRDAKPSSKGTKQKYNNKARR